ncbi:MAG: hypothetical protein JWO86_244 [Myxococcaceae bacterium]|nr:hypothetical protein [Myxococcaceae bacterium]
MKPSEEERALAALLRSGRADPSRDDLERLERRLSPWLGHAPSSTWNDGGRGVTWKAIVFLAALGLSSRSDVTPSEAPRNATVTATARATQAASPSAAPLTNHVHDTPVVAPSSESTVSVSDLPNAPIAAAGRVAPPAPKANDERGAATEARANLANGAPEESADTSPARETSESEASFLRRAQTTLNGDPATALQMLEQHPARFPQGVLVQERDVMAIDALARLGRTDEARARARAFAVRYPRSAHESRIASILKEGGAP